MSEIGFITGQELVAQLRIKNNQLLIAGGKLENALLVMIEVSGEMGMGVKEARAALREWKAVSDEKKI